MSAGSDPVSESRPGPRNAITDVPGIALGSAHDEAVRSGVTVVLPEAPAVAAVDLRGGGTGTREVALLEADATVEHVHAIVLSGGSAFGLAAADGAMGWLAARGRGFPVADARVPIVPAAILFDLANGGDKRAFAAGDVDMLPYRALARQACETAGADVALGNAGAGYGAVAGPLKGGLGSASVIAGHGATLGAVASVNAIGSAVVPGSGRFWAAPWERGTEFGGLGPAPEALADPDLIAAKAVPSGPGANTTLAVVATDAVLTRAQARRLAVMAQDGFARALRPVHTPLDGDAVFVLSTGRVALADPVADLARLGMLAADCVARAIARGVYEARALGGVPAWRDVWEGELRPGA